MIYDRDFLKELFRQRNKITYARITALTFDEEPVQLIEGIITQGSVNIDGSSRVRRTCSLSLAGDNELGIDDFLWGVKSKFKLEIGLDNEIDDTYPPICWFSQGVFVITAFNTTINTQNWQVSISGKDKMCLLNGEMGGALPASIDFGKEEFVDKEANTTTYSLVPIETILRESLHTYAQEPYHNIVINDLDTMASELLEYKGDTPLYLLRDSDGIFVNYTTRGDTSCIVDGKQTTLNDEDSIQYDHRVDMAEMEQAEISRVKLVGDPHEAEYTIAKVERGQTVGYRQTDLTYAGDLISNIGETLTSIYDKIVNMLGDFEYFYDLNGQFVFQRKKTYIQSSWNNIVKNNNDTYVVDNEYASSTIYDFEEGELITSYQNNPNLANVKNDFSIWGERTSVNNVKIPVHYRYAIDKKPTKYTRIEVNGEDIEGYNTRHPESPMKEQSSQLFTTGEYDWREIIYRMALDFYAYGQLDSFCSKIIEANGDLYPLGHTGYEQYYIDLQGFWRELYDPDCPKTYQNENISEGELVSSTKELFIKDKWELIRNPSLEDKEDMYAIINKEPHKWVEAIRLYQYNDVDEYSDEGDRKVSKHWYNTISPNVYTPVNYSLRGRANKAKLKYLVEGEGFIDIYEYYRRTVARQPSLYKRTQTDYYKVSDITDPLIKELYIDDSGALRPNYRISRSKITGEIDVTIVEREEPIQYVTVEASVYITPEEASGKYSDRQYWNKQIIEEPSSLNFWMEFLDTEGELSQFSVPSIGVRAKASKDSAVKGIYFREVPNLVFTTYQDYLLSDLSQQTGYIPVFIRGNLESMFQISSQGKSAKDVLDQQLYQFSYCSENITIQSVPIYYFEPNTRIAVHDSKSGIEGEYLVSRITLPLAYNGTMSITATKAPKIWY